MREEGETHGADLVLRPIGDLLEGILSQGPMAFRRYVALYPTATQTNRIAILLAGLAMGPEVKEAVREQLSQRMSPEKRAFGVGLGEMGHPEVEGFFAQMLREKSSHLDMQTAIWCLGRVRGRRSLPLVIEALDDPFLFETACAALEAFGGSEAVSALMARSSELPSLRALANLGAEESRDLFLRGLEEDPPRRVEAIRGIGRMGDRSIGRFLIPFLGSADEAEAAAAFEAYAALGAPDGVEPLLKAAEGELSPGLASALGRLDHPAAHRRLVAALTPRPRKGLMDWLVFWRRRENSGDDRQVYRALRGSEDPEVLQALAARLLQESEPAMLRELLGNRALVLMLARGEGMLQLWRREDLLTRYMAARALIQVPSAQFLSEALILLGDTGFAELDRYFSLRDREEALSIYARENNPCLLLGGLLDSGLVDLDEIRKGLEARIATWAFPSDAPLRETLSHPKDKDVALFLEALAEARPAIREPVRRLWNFLAQWDDRGDPLLDLFLCYTGSHRGGIQRSVFEALPSSIGQFVRGRDDRFIPELDVLARQVPANGPFRQPLLDLFAKARRTLMAECRDMTLLGEGQARGDMVVIEELRSGR
jgi:HEAT repeat protein